MAFGPRRALLAATIATGGEPSCRLRPKHLSSASDCGQLQQHSISESREVSRRKSALPQVPMLGVYPISSFIYFRLVDQLITPYPKGDDMSLVLDPSTVKTSTDHGFDALLGSADDRYLGEGHRRVGLTLGMLNQISNSEFSTTAQLTYPPDWSTKAGASRTAHLSTVDAIRIAGHLHRSLALQVPMLAQFSAERSLTVRAGSRPWEALDDVPVQTEVLQTERDGAVRLQHKIGSLKVLSDWEKPGQALPTADAWAAGQVSGVRLLPDDRVECVYERTTERDASMPFLEAMMLTAQMAQVALYSGDAARRDASGNMWMRRAQFVRRQWSSDRMQLIVARLENRRELTVGGRQIGTADVHADNVFGIQVNASLASRA